MCCVKIGIVSLCHNVCLRVCVSRSVVMVFEIVISESYRSWNKISESGRGGINQGVIPRLRKCGLRSDRFV